ncbi:MAG: hypothetical protein ACXWUG_30440 [Polyangiales bacterium]
MSALLGCEGGCGALVEESVGPVPSRESKGDAGTAAIDVGPEIVAATSCTDKTGRSGFACCIAEVELTADAGAVDKSATCCEAIIDFLDSEMSTPSHVDDYDYASKNSVVQMCCRSLKAWSKPTCTPWGPPAPPAMEDEVA